MTERAIKQTRKKIIVVTRGDGSQVVSDLFSGTIATFEPDVKIRNGETFWMEVRRL